MTPDRLQLVDGEHAGAGEDSDLAEHGAAAAPRPLAFPDVAEWVQHVLLPQYGRPATSSDIRWCPYWWEHAEAMVRLEETWRAWEHLRHEGATGPAVWWRDFGDPMLREITSPVGPFFKCSYTGADSSRNKHEVPPTWVMAQPPPGLFDEPVGFGHEPAVSHAAIGGAHSLAMPSCAWRRGGAPGNTCDWTPPPAARSGSAITPTTTSGADEPDPSVGAVPRHCGPR